MATKVNWTTLGIAVLGGLVVGVSVGLGTGLAARALGWPTGFVAPLTSGVVSALVLAIYATRSKRDQNRMGKPASPTSSVTEG